MAGSFMLLLMVNPEVEPSLHASRPLSSSVRAGVPEWCPVSAGESVQLQQVLWRVTIKWVLGELRVPGSVFAVGLQPSSCMPWADQCSCAGAASSAKHAVCAVTVVGRLLGLNGFYPRVPLQTGTVGNNYVETHSQTMEDYAAQAASVVRCFKTVRICQGCIDCIL